FSKVRALFCAFLLYRSPWHRRGYPYAAGERRAYQNVPGSPEEVQNPPRAISDLAAAVRDAASTFLPHRMCLVSAAHRLETEAGRCSGRDEPWYPRAMCCGLTQEGPE